ncbi:MAG: ClpX C4-type zinc finger [Rhodospirillales bacterium]|nr:ClpX C4-type zinc finger [Rhodospirillales bacterium]
MRRMSCGRSSMADGNCSFCGKAASQVFRIISSNGAKICNECVGRCADMIADEYRKVAKDVQFPEKGDDET